MLDGHFRTPIERWMRPVGVSVKRAGISADAVTVAGLVMSIGCAFAVGSGAVRLGAVLLARPALPDPPPPAWATRTPGAAQRGFAVGGKAQRSPSGQGLRPQIHIKDQVGTRHD